MRGRFWLAETPRMCVDGKLDVEERTAALDEELVSCMVVTKQTPTMLERSPLMDTNERYLLHGDLEDGTEVTVPNATRGGCSHSKQGVVQNFLFLMHLSGGHVSPAETYDGAVVTFGAPWPAWLSTASWSAQILMGKAGGVTLSLEQGTLTFQKPGLSLQDWERYALGPLRSLLMLVAGQEAPPESLVLQSPSQGEIVVHRPTSNHPPRQHFEPVINFRELGQDRLCAWYDLASKTVPTTTVIGTTLARQHRDIEGDVLRLAAAAESIHRKIFNDKTMSNGQARQLTKLALEGVPEEQRELIADRLIRLNEPDFDGRLDLLLSRTGDFAEALAGRKIENSDPGPPQGRDVWVQMVKKSRNGSAHLLYNAPDDLYTYSGEMYILYESLRWLVTAILLSHIGVAMETVIHGIKNTSSYQLFRERTGLLPGVYQVSK